MIAVLALVFAFGGAVAGADPPSWAHGGGNGHGDGGPGGDGHGHGDHGGGPPPGAQGNGAPNPAPAASPPPAAPPTTPAGGDGGGDNPRHGGTPPGHGGTPPGHDPGHHHGDGQGGGSTGAPAPAPVTPPAQTTNQPTATPVVTTPVASTPVISTPITAPPLVTPTGPSVTPVTRSPSDRVTISQLAALRSGRGAAGRPGAVLSTGRSATALVLGSPLTLSLAPAQTGAVAASAPTTTVLSHPHHGVKLVQPPSSGPATEITHFISRIPAWVWIALAAAIGFGAVAAGAAVRSGRRARRRADEVAAVTATASTDQLTGVLNRRGFTDSAERELDRARRYGRPLALAYVDVRGLKAVNDSEGHLAGDHVLREVAVLLSESARAHDLVGRMGGDELAVLLAEQEDSGAAAMTRRVREQVPNHRAALGLSTDWDVTIGTASFPDDGDTLEELVAAADRRLYEQRGIELR